MEIEYPSIFISNEFALKYILNAYLTQVYIYWNALLKAKHIPIDFRNYTIGSIIYMKSISLQRSFPIINETEYRSYTSFSFKALNTIS